MAIDLLINNLMIVFETIIVTTAATDKICSAVLVLISTNIKDLLCNHKGLKQILYKKN